MENSKRCVILCLHDDWWFVEKSIEAVKSFGPVFAFVSRSSWNRSVGDWEKVAGCAESAGAEVVLGDWSNETEHRRTALEFIREKGFEYALIPDGDEVVEPKLLDKLIKIADGGIADIVRAHMDTYWKSARYVIRPREQLAPAILINLNAVSHVYIRDFEGGSAIVLGPEHGVIHHLSYAGPDERIHRKITTWSHKHELVQDWYRNVWQAWDENKLLRDLHPTHPPAYGLAERIEIPAILNGVWDERPVANPNADKPAKWPTVSIVIPLHGGADDIRMCLESLKASQDLIHETIVVDDTSPDNAAEVAGQFKVTLIHNETNLGFGRTCNRGSDASTGEVILFLNSDTIVPRVGLIKLIEGLMESGSIGASGPMSNNVGYHQRLSPTYTSLDTLDLFAADLAALPSKNKDVEILVGFALAVRRSVLNEVGVFDDRFGRGLFEDTDLCYRMSRAGYRLRMVTTAYVHHWGSRTLTRAIPDVTQLLEENGVLYRNKWQRDLETGYASHLPGFGMNDGLVRFNEARHPDRLADELEKLRDKAHISLCMIVKNEERVLGQCLASALPYFFEVIVVDTGSTDKTKEIAREFGVKLIESSWPDSFAEARNESLSYATGDWIFWLDADDVLPFSSGEQVLHAALNAPADITGFVVPVQFVEEGLRGGTKVDHVKLIRNFPGIKFEGRIHEQILTSIREHGGEIARLEAVVLHAGYDTSVKGQANKRERDWHLLKLDLADRPEHPFVWFNIGMTHHFTSGHEEAVHALRESIRFSGEHDSHLRKAYSLMGVSYRELGRLDDAKRAFQEGLDKVGEDPELTFQLAMTATAMGDLQHAKHLYETMPQDTGSYFSSVDIGILTFKRLHNLGGIRMAMGDYVGARKDWEEAFSLNPSSTVSLYALCDAALEVGDFRTSHKCLESLARAEGMNTDWAERRCKLAEQTEDEELPLQIMYQYTQTHPNSVGPRLMVSRYLLSGNHVEAAIPHLQHLQGQGVAEAAFMLGVSAIRTGDIGQAIQWTERAVQLNPGHLQSVEQLAKLRQLVDEVPASVLSEAEQKELLTGPDAGLLPQAVKRHSVVIVTYNSAQWILKCLASVLPTLGLNDEVIVVDNASADGTAEVVEALGVSQIRVIANADNLGYACAANVGVRSCEGEYVTLLNPDTEVSSGWLEALASRLGLGIGAAGPVSDNIGGDQFVGHYVQSGIPIAELSSVLREEHAGQGRSTKLLMGMCLMVRREVLNAVGLLDEDLFLGADDLDFSWRLRMLGYDQVVALDVFVHHAGQKSFETRERSVVTDLVAKSDGHLVAKLIQFYGNALPTSHQIWGCDIFDGALQGMEAACQKKRYQYSSLAKSAKVSLCMIVRDEQRVLADCLRTARPFFEQIIVVDTGSTDATKEIAKQFNCEVYDFPWTESFSEARNESIKYATGNWIFWMDADDTISEESGEAILRVTLDAPEEIFAFVVPVQFVTDDLGSGTRVDHVKLFRNVPGVEFEGRIHEQNLPSIRRLGGKVARCNAFVLHSGYDTSPEGQAKKRERDYKLLQLDLQERPDHPFVLFNFGMTDYYTNQPESAIGWLDKSIAASQIGDSHLRKAYSLKSSAYKALGNLEQALSSTLQGLSIVGEDSELRFQAGVLFTDLAKFDEAKEQYLAIGTDDESHFSSLDMGILGAKRFHNLGVVSILTNDYGEARKWWQKNLNQIPVFLPSAIEMFRSAAKQNDLQTAKATMDAVFSSYGCSEEWAIMLSDYIELTQSGNADAAISELRKVVANNPAELGPRLVLSRALLNRKLENEAKPHLKILVQNGLGEAAFYLGVASTREGNFSEALNWMQKSHEMNPGHEDTLIQLNNLQLALSEQ